MVQSFFFFVRSVDRKNNALIGCRFLSGDFYARTRICKECEVESEMSGFDQNTSRCASRFSCSL